MDLIKHISIFDPSRLTGAVGVVGVGALGSAAAIQIAKLGVTDLVLFDHDIVEERNLPNQILYGPRHVGMSKVAAAAEMIETLTGYTPRQAFAKLEDRHLLSMFDVRHLLVCVDSMSARDDIFQNCVWMNPNIAYYCDGRMGSAHGSVHGFVPTDLRMACRYREEELFPDDEVEIDRAACGTILSIGATASNVASHMVWHFIEASQGREMDYHALYVEIASPNMPFKHTYSV